MSRKSLRNRKHGKHTRKAHAGRKSNQKGGYGKGAGPVGYGMESDPVTWPGVMAANGANTDGATMSNYYPLSKNGIAVGGVKIAVPEVGQFGGKKHMRKRAHSKASKSRKHMKAHKGGKAKSHKKHSKSRKMHGGFGPQELINFGRDMKYWAKGAFSDYMGFQPPVDPSPLVQPIGERYRIIEPNPTNLPRSYNLAGSSVAPL